MIQQTCTVSVTTGRVISFIFTDSNDMIRASVSNERTNNILHNNECHVHLRRAT